MSSDILVRKDDYVVVQTGKKKQLAKVINPKPGKLKVLLDGKHLHSPASSDGSMIRVESSDILANLFDRPELGSVYGVVTEPYFKTVMLKGWGPVHFFRDLADSEWESLQRSFKKVHRYLDELSLTRYLPIELEIRPVKGKYDGLYRHSSDGDTMELRPQDFLRNDYVISHEMGHHVWFRYLSPRLKVKWIKMYHGSVALSKISSADLTSMYRDFSNSGMSVNEYRKDLDDEAKVIFESAISWVKDNHRINRDDLDLIISEGDSFEDYWPRDELDISDMQVTISDYANKNVKEYFAEAFAFNYAGYELPKAVKKLLRKTLEAVANSEASAEEESVSSRRSERRKRRRGSK